ncbi:MAG: hypothetical protein AAFR65_04050 [Pseudomonadota bacterium]
MGNDLILTLLASASAAITPLNTGDDVLAALKAQAEGYQPRATCSVTVNVAVDSEGSDGATNEEMIFRFDHTTEEWTVLKGPENGGDDDEDGEDEGERPAPEDWYARALKIVGAADRIEAQGADTYLLYTEDLAKGTLVDGERDNSKRSRGETMVSTASGKPLITGYTVSLKKPFRVPLIVRVKNFQEEVEFGAGDDYGPLATSRTNTWDVSFTGGSERGTAALTYSDYDCPA